METRVAYFESNGCSEYFITLESSVGLNLESALSEAMAKYGECLQGVGLTMSSEIVLRLHVSDVHNQYGAICHILDDFNARGFVSIVGQPPASGAKICIEAYHIQSKALERKPLYNGVVETAIGPYTVLWTRPKTSLPAIPEKQTEAAFKEVANILSKRGETLSSALHRTWIYVRDVDNNYQQMVDERTRIFKEHHLTKDTHYISSTGIEGLSERPDQLVSIDCMAVTGLEQGQVEYMHARDNLCPTYEYDVTFERGTQIIYGDRSHYYISGTASIDNKGQTVHLGDVLKQTERALTNIAALLENSHANFDDIKLATIYLRDTSDYKQVMEYLNKNLNPQWPFVIVKGAVCRPEWLIEIEVIAVNANGDSRFTPFA